MSGRAKLIAGLVAAIVLLNVVTYVVRELTPEPEGPPSSSYATTPSGLAAYASLLERRGHRVRRLRERPADRLPDPGVTVVLADPRSLGAGDPGALRRFAVAGGRVVVAGRGTERLLEALAGGPRPVRDRGGPRTVVAAGRPAPETEDVGTVSSAGAGWEKRPAATDPVLGAPGAAPLLVVGRVGRGRVVALADSAPLQNAGLARADNAALALRVAGPRERPVVFAESVHGYEPARGLAALPGRWQVALGGLLLAAIVALLAIGRRFGPPEQASRPLPPAAARVRRRPGRDAAPGARSARRDGPAARPRALGGRAPLGPARRRARGRRRGGRAGPRPGPGGGRSARRGDDGQDVSLAGGRALARLHQR
jgi:hypothetical protein